MSEAPDYLTIKEAAQLMRVPTSWIHARTRLNQMPGMRRIGKYVRVNRQELLAWIEAQGSGKHP